MKPTPTPPWSGLGRFLATLTTALGLCAASSLTHAAITSGDRILVDIGPSSGITPSAAGSYWNNISRSSGSFGTSSTTALSGASNLVRTSDGLATGVALFYTTKSPSGAVFSHSAATNSGAVNAGYPISAAKDRYYLGGGNNSVAGTHTFELRGLDPSLTYDFKAFGTFTSAVPETVFTVDTDGDGTVDTSASYQPHNNGNTTATFASFTGVVAASSGVVKFTVSNPGAPTTSGSAHWGVLDLVAVAPTPAEPYGLSAATYLGSTADNDAVKGMRIQSNGTLVLAANIGTATPGGVTPILLNGATATSGGAIVRLSADGRTVLSVARIAAEVLDLALDDADNIVVAAKTGGVLKLNSTATTLVWAQQVGTHIHRVDASGDGHVVAHKPGNLSDPDSAAGSGTTYLYDSAGNLTSSFSGYRNTTDVCIDGTSQVVIQIGWRQTNAYDGNSTQPVQISYLRALDYTGAVVWLNYDWSSTSSDPNFINKYTNNMADTRGYRCSIGRDGKLYAAFECAGGNHIFRWRADNLAQAVTVVKGDRWHDFYSTAAEHKTFFARYEPATGDYLLGQQLVNRLTSGKGSAIRVRRGEIRADELGRVYIGGSCASGLPIPFAPFYTPQTGQIAYNPFDSSTYTGGSWFMVLSPGFNQRLYTTRLAPNGETNAIDARVVAGTRRAVWGGSVASGLFTVSPVQAASAGGTSEGFAAVIPSAN